MRHTLTRATIIACACAIPGHGFADQPEIELSPDLIIEVAGADDSGSADPDALRKSGTNMVPANESAPSRDPLAPETPAKMPEPATAIDDDSTSQEAAPAALAAPQPTEPPTAPAAQAQPAAEETAPQPTAEQTPADTNSRSRCL